MRRYQGEVITAAVFVVLAAYVIWDASRLPTGASLFPIFSAASILALSLYRIGSATLRRKPELREKLRFDWSYANMKPMAVFALTIGYVWLISILGYFSATLLYFIAGSLTLGMRNWRSLALTAGIMLPFIYGLFVLVLGARMPQGALL